MTEKSVAGFEYFLDDETILRYQAKPLEQRLRWLYMGNLLRQAYPPETRKLHELFRTGAGEEEFALPDCSSARNTR